MVTDCSMPSPNAVSDESPTKRFQFVGGALCLDFCNTVGGMRGLVAREMLHEYKDFISWSEQATLLDSTQTGILRSRAAVDPGMAGEVLTRARDLREAIYRIFLAAAERTEPSLADIGILNSELARSMCRLRIRAAQDKSRVGFEWAW